MKPGNNDAEFLYHKGKFVGVNLGWDFSAEHECGIGDIKQIFGIVDKPSKDLVGFDVRTITNMSDHLVYKNTDECEYLVFNVAFYDDETPETLFDRYRHRCNAELFALWSDRSFAIRSTKKSKLLKKLYKAFQKLDIVIFKGVSGPFSNGGLKICIASRIPSAAREEAAERDLDYLRLQDASKATGIIQRLRKAQEEDRDSYPRKCAYFACSPRWKSENRGFDTVHPVVYWLNPMDQRNNNSGWYTVEQLDQWIKDKGPVPKKHRQR